MRALGAALVGIATCVAVSGCNAILGNEVHELAQDAAGGAGGAATGGTGGQSGMATGGTAAGGAAGAGTAGAGTAGASTAGAGGASGTGGAAGAGGTAGGGTSGTGGTAGAGGAATGGAAGVGGIVIRDASTDDGSAGSVTRDSSVGNSDATPPGPDGTIQDGNADGEAGCVPNSTECRGRSVFLCTSGGVWIEILQCPAACVTGACTGSCVPGMAQCMGMTPQTCDQSGQWQTGAPCPFVCTQGQCTGVCNPGSIQPCGMAETCNPNAAQACDMFGVWGPCLPAPTNCTGVPAGWEPVALVPAGGTCPDGFEQNWGQTVYTSASAAPFTCTCGCSGTQACEGTVTLNESIFCGGPVMPARSFAISNQCSSGDYGYITNGYSYYLSGIDFGARPACATNPTPISQPPAQTTTATRCTPNLTCPSGGACLSASQTASLCVAKPGIVACPQGYPNGTKAAPWYDDTRWCGACSCASTLTCTLTSVLIDNNFGCAAGPNYYMYVTDACTTSNYNYPGNYVQAFSKNAGSPSCGETSPSNPIGTVELPPGNTETICCR
jgi:hypothetical protein